MPADTALVAATTEHLGRFAPFDRMDQAHLIWLAEHLSLGYYAKGETLLSPEQGEVDTFFIIKQGVIQGEREGESAWLELHEGECFPIGALLSHRAAISRFRAQSDVFCYELPAPDFHALLELSSPFHAFCTLRLADLLAQSQRQTQARYLSAATEQQSLESTLGSLIRRAPITCSPETPLRHALKTMSEQRIGSIIIARPGESPLGIFTVRDLIDRVILPDTSLDTPMQQAMSTNPVTLPSTAHAFEAALAMAKHGIRHVLVVDANQLTGVVSEKDLFSLQRIGVTQISSAIRSASEPDQLQQAAADIRQLGHNMMAQGVGAEQLTLLLSTLNDLLTQRILELECAKTEFCHEGVCWLAFGSEGRLEQTLATDQDNGIIFTLAPGESPEAIRGKLLHTAERINRALDACGFPLCQGQIMAMNPKWCLSLDEWKARFARWIDAGDPEALLNASIFFDFRPLYGEATLAHELRQWLGGKTAANPRFLHQMVANALRNRPPLGLVRDFVTDSDGEHADTLDLKLNGAMPFVDAARVYALATGSPATGTAQRLRHAGPRLNIPKTEIEAWIAAFFFIQLLRLRRQHEENESGQPLDNRIDPDQLNDLDRRILKEAFRQARKMQARLALDYQA